MSEDKVSLTKFKFYVMSLVNNLEKEKKRNEVNIIKIEKTLIHMEKEAKTLQERMENEKLEEKNE